MPRIPTQSQQPIRAGGFQAGRVAPVQDFTGQQMQQAARALEFAGASVTGLGARIQEENDVARIKEAVKEFRAFSQGHLSQKDGYRSRLGKDAMDAFEGAAKAFDDKREALLRGLQNEGQRTRFSEAIEGAMLQGKSVLETHAVGEGRRYNLAETKASMDVEAQAYRDAVMSDPVEAQASMGRLRAQADELADLTGMGPDQRKQLLEQTVSGAHASAFDAMMEAEDTDGARAYLKTHGGDMAPGLRQKAQGILRKATRLDKVLRVSDRIFEAGGNLETMLDKAQALFDKGEISGEVRQAVERRVEGEVLTQRREQATLAKKALSDAQMWVDSGAPLTPQMAQDLEDSGEAWKLDAYLANGGGWKTTSAGLRKLFTITPAELSEFSSAEEVWDEFRADLDDDNLAMMVRKWEGAQVAAGRAARDAAGASGAKDAYAMNQDDHLMVLYRSLPDIDENLEEPENVAQWDRYRLAVIEEANRLAGPNGTKTMETLRQAHEVVAREKLHLGGEERTSALLGQSEVQEAQVMTPWGLRDVNKFTDEDLMRADEQLREEVEAENRKRLAAGQEPIDWNDIPSEARYVKAEHNLQLDNKKARVQELGVREQGMARLGAAVRRLRNDPTFRKEWRVFGPGGEVRKRVTRERRDFFGRVKPGWGTETYTIPYRGTLEDKFEDMVMDRIGAQVGKDFGVEDAEVRAAIRRMLGMSDEALRGIYKTDQADSGLSAGAAAGLGAVLGGGK